MNKIQMSLAALLIGGSIVSAGEPAPVVTPGGTKVQIYGRLELNAAYEDGKTSTMWRPIAPKKAEDGDGSTMFSIARTRLGLNLSGPAKESEPELKGKFEADFSGSDSYSNFNGSSGFRIRQSWGSVAFKNIGLTLLFGQTDDLIAPLDPAAVNPSSLNAAGNIGNRRPQIRATQALGPVEIAVAALHDRLGGDYDASTPPAAPSFQGRLGLKVPASWAGEKANLALGVGGMWADYTGVDEAKAVTGNAGAYAFAADLSLPLIDILTLTSEFFMGQNLARYGDGSLRLNDYNSGISSLGFWASLAAKLPANLSAATGIGMENLDDDSKKAGQIESNMAIFANLGYSFTSAATVAFEYTNIQTAYTNDNDGNRNRFELNFRYNFR